MRHLLRITSLLALLAVWVMAQEPDNMKAIPAAAEGMTRHVLRLPALDDELTAKVELIVGKTVKLDERNRYFFGGKIEEETIDGWSFPKYTVRELGPMAGTLMAVDPNAPQTDRFVTLGGQPFFVRYNSRLPIVVYVPKETEVRYRIWRADADSRPIDKG